MLFLINISKYSLSHAYAFLLTSLFKVNMKGGIRKGASRRSANVAPGPDSDFGNVHISRYPLLMWGGRGTKVPGFLWPPRGRDHHSKHLRCARLCTGALQTAPYLNSLVALFTLKPKWLIIMKMPLGKGDKINQSSAETSKTMSSWDSRPEDHR